MLWGLFSTRSAQQDMVLPLQHLLEGKYEILEKIGEGGIGSIYKVRHRLLDEIRVIKVLQPQAATKEDLQKRFLHEARMAIKLKHPNIAQLYDFAITEEGTAYIVMEFIDGVTLDAMLQASGTPSIDLTLEISRQALAALSYLHAQHFVHRDVSPDNLMLTTNFDGDPLVKLIDLGIAKNLDGELKLTATGMFLGKVRYSSPEQFCTEGDGAGLDHRSDIYSFGVLLYELLTGEYLFSGTTFNEIAAAHLFQSPRSFDQTDPEDKVPEGLRQIVLQALEKKPDKRFSSSEEFSRHLAESCAPHRPFQEEWERCVAVTTVSTSKMKPFKKPGSTQDRLDRDFEMVTTPSPQPLSEISWDRTTAAPHAKAIGATAARTTAGSRESESRRLWGRFALGFAAAATLVSAFVIWTRSGQDLWQLVNPTDQPATEQSSLDHDPDADGGLGASQDPGSEASTEQLEDPQPADSQPLPPIAGQSFTFTSLPTGATVYLSDQKLVDPTPVQGVLFPGTAYRLRLELEGYETSGMEFALEQLSEQQRQSRSLHFPLIPSVPPGVLVVRSDYPAEMRVGNRELDSVQGETRLELEPGSYAVEVTAPSVYYESRQTVEIESGVENLLDLPSAVSVAIAAAPSHCRVSIDGREVDFVPFAVNLAVGPHTFEFNWETLGRSQTIEKLVTRETRRVFAAADNSS